MKTVLKNLFCMDIEGDIKKDFKAEISRINLLRAKITAVTFLGLELAVIIIILFTKRDTLFEYPNNIYMGLYLLMMFVMIIYLICFFQMGKDIINNVDKINVIGISFSSFILAWCAYITILDQLSNGQITVYAMAVISIAVFPLFKPLVLFVMYISVHTLFLFSLPAFQLSSELIIGNYINSTVIVVFSLIISRGLYRNKINDFTNKYIIQKNNKALGEMNHELTVLNKKLEKLSYTDSLTGLLNRRKFDELLNKVWESCKRSSSPISVIMIDIDFFKSFNDLYGHQLWDKCIIQVANTIINTSRRSDIIARYGGEEFIIALPDSDSDRALIAAERIRNNIEALKIFHKSSLSTNVVTVSLGVGTCIPSERLTSFDLIQIADNALYKAKSDKRNMSVSLKI